MTTEKAHGCHRLEAGLPWHEPEASPAVKESRRKLVVFSCLVGGLSLTSALLLALAPAPLIPDASRSLFAIDAPRTLDVVFETRVPAQSGRWKYIYIRHSKTTSGNALSLGQASGGVIDHFVIGNGDGCIDGEIQVSHLWNDQLPAGTPAGTTRIDPSCISICVIGDFDRSVPTPTQMRRLAQLVGTLQGRLNISPEQVFFIEEAPGAAGIGRYFPSPDFRQQLLP
jgi:hypothetical protein